MKEIWKHIPGYEGFMASNLGRIRSLKRIINYGNRLCLRQERILKPHKSKYPYYTIAPFQKTTSVHILICLAFKGARPLGAVIDHINGNPLDNREVNLRYTTQKENVANALRLGAIHTGERCSWSKLKVIDVINIRRDKRSCKTIAAEYKISHQTVSEIKLFKIWKQLLPCE